MSHIVSIECQIRDMAAVRAACQRLGWTLDVHSKTFRWYGRFMGDSQDWTAKLRALGISEAEYGRCDAEIRVPDADHSIGLMHRQGRLVPLWDYWLPSSRGLTQDQLTKQVSTPAGPLSFLQAYGLEKAKIEARKCGLSVKGEERQANGTIRVVLQEAS